MKKSKIVQIGMGVLSLGLLMLFIYACDQVVVVDDDNGNTSNPGNTGNTGTSGKFRVNSAGKITKDGQVMPIHCGAWFGLEGQHEPPDAENNANGAPMELYVGNMWWRPSGRTIQDTMEEITREGFNVIRLPIAPQTLDANDPQGIGDIRSGGVLKNDASVRQENARQALENFLSLAKQNGLDVIVDIHSCSNYVGWRAGRLDASPPFTDATRGEGYPYTREDYSCGPAGAGVTVHEYNEGVWLSNLKELASLASQYDNILAIDIFNEPWDYTWAEWKRLSEKAFQAIDSVNKDVLIMVEGVGSETSSGTKVPHGDEATNPNWGENLYGAKSAPLNIPKDRLIYSPHTYGPSVFVQRQFLAESRCADLEGNDAGRAGCTIDIDKASAKIEAGWEEHFGFLKDEGYAVVIGEFGGNMDWPNGAEAWNKAGWENTPSGVDREWQQALVTYMLKRDIEGCYWSINPESGDTGGLYNHAYSDSDKGGWGTWQGINTERLNLLKRLWKML